MSIKKDMTLGEILDRYPESEMILMGFGMHCFSCPMSRMETLEEAAMVHDIDLNLMLKKLNEMDAESGSFGDLCDCVDDCDCEDDCDCINDCNCIEDCDCGDYDCEDDFFDDDYFNDEEFEDDEF